MDILPIEVIFYQSLLLIINLYYKLSIFIKNQQRFTAASFFYSTVTDFAKLRGLSTSAPRCNAA